MLLMFFISMKSRFGAVKALLALLFYQNKSTLGELKKHRFSNKSFPSHFQYFIRF